MLSERVVNTDKFEGHIVSGLRESGKSGFLEVLGEEHYLAKRIVLDLHGASDGESLFWCVPGRNRIYYPIILVHPPWIEVQFPKNNPFQSIIKPMSCETPLLDIVKTAKRLKRIVTVPTNLYPLGSGLGILTEYFYNLDKVADKVKTPFFVLLREAHIAFSQFSIFPKQEKDFRKSLFYFFKEARHHRTSLAVDVHRHMDFIKAARTLMDHIHFKKSNRSMIPPEYSWFIQAIKDIRAKFPFKKYKLREMNYPPVTRLYPSEFYTLDSSEAVEPIERAGLPRFHHKTPWDDFTKITGVNFKQVMDIPAEYLPEKEKETLAERIMKIKILHPHWSNRSIAKEAKCSAGSVNNYLAFSKE